MMASRLPLHETSTTQVGSPALWFAHLRAVQRTAAAERLAANLQNLPDNYINTLKERQAGHDFTGTDGCFCCRLT